LKRAYLYPITGRDDQLGLYNPYLDDFIASLKGKVTIVNEKDRSKSGIFNVIKYISKINLVFFNWIENVPDRKGGLFQTVFLYFFFLLSKILKIRIIWTMHNKLSHSRENYASKKRIFKFILKNADLVITHSKAGKTFGEEMVPGTSSKIHYLPHPVKDRRLETEPVKQYDILIWGTIAPYKGIDKFLEYLIRENLEKKYRILIVGKITSQEYAGSLLGFSSANIEIQNKFIEDDLLQNLIGRSKIVLFTYSMSSILSSGVLIDSLGYGANIVGPHVGAFADLADDGIITTFNDFPEMISKIDGQLENSESKSQITNLERFLNENSWNGFSIKLLDLIE
jgi:glycosyltransferase involved in cell wall biosynthesis